MTDLHDVLAEFDDRQDKAFEDPWAERIVRCPACAGYFAEDEGKQTPYGMVCGPCAESFEDAA